MELNIYHFLKVLKFIPKGKVISYKQFSRFTGLPIRFASKILSRNEKLDKFPCYKVIKSNGFIGNYKLGIEEKKKRLEKEGIKVENYKVLKEYFWNINKKIIWRKLQMEALRCFKIYKSKKLPIDSIIAVDVHYKNNFFISVALGYYKGRNLKVIEKGKVVNEYKSSFLFFTQFYPIYKALKNVKEAIVIVNSLGLFHPIIGFASHLTVALKNCYTIGVTKKILKFEGAKIENDFLFKDKQIVGKKVGKFYVTIGNLELSRSIQIFEENVELLKRAHKIAKREIKKVKNKVVYVLKKL